MVARPNWQSEFCFAHNYYNYLCMCALFMYVLAREADDDLKMEFLVYRQHGRNLILEPTDEAKRVELQNKSHSGTFRAHHPEAVESDARARIRNLHMPAAEVCPAGLETVSPQAVLAYSVLQFGKYRGQTFQMGAGKCDGLGCGVCT